MSNDTNKPLVRLDYNQHGDKPAMHLQYGGKETEGGCYTGRTGQEAVEILADIMTKCHIKPIDLNKINEDLKNTDFR